jgi:hypothetical protein
MIQETTSHGKSTESEMDFNSLYPFRIENRQVKEEKGNNDLITILNMLF